MLFLFLFVVGFASLGSTVYGGFVGLWLLQCTLQCAFNALRALLIVVVPLCFSPRFLALLLSSSSPAPSAAQLWYP